MESLSEYLFRSSVWLTGFGLIYFVFLRNERYFGLNRIFLLAGMILSASFPFFRFHYMVVMPVPEPATAIDLPGTVIPVVAGKPNEFNFLLWLYVSGIIFLIFRLLKHVIIVARVIRRSGYVLCNGLRLVRTDYYPGAFSFFRYVFVNRSAGETEIAGIMCHEQGHIRQRHWIDLIIFELVCALQWFNPVVWLYGRFIRQNHEYLADRSALLRSQDPGQYRAILLNQMAGAPVIQLANSFSYSLNKKRFVMMKKTNSSPLRTLKLLWTLPFIAGAFYAFATPRYSIASEEVAAKQDVKGKLSVIETPPGYVRVPDIDSDPETAKDNQTKRKQEVTPEYRPATGTNEIKGAQKIVRGKVIDGYGNPLEGVLVVASRTNMTQTDADGNFELDMTNDDPVSFTHEGLKTTWRMMPDFEKSTIVKMEPETWSLAVHIATTGVVKPLSLDADSLNKEASQDKNDRVYTVVRQMPEFPGGLEALRRFIGDEVRYPKIAAEDGIQGQVFVRFVVNREGNIWNARVIKPVHPALDQEAIRVIYSLPQWKPGVHHGRAVNVEYTVPIAFSIN